MNEWEIYLGRITLFPAMPTSSPLPSALDLYRQIWGSDPDHFQKQANPLLPTVAQGRRGSLMVNCTGQAVRIDFNLQAAPSQVPQTTVALIDRPIELRDELMRIINFLGGSLVLGKNTELGKNGTTWNHFSRVGLALQFLNLKPSHEEANKAVTQVIPGQYGVTITDEQDFVFQINQPHMSGEFQDIGMNFLTKWSVERFQILTFSLAPGGVSAFPQPITVIAASVTFDNNNIPLTPARALTSREQSALLQEALDAAVRKQQEIGLNIEGF